MTEKQKAILTHCGDLFTTAEAVNAVQTVYYYHNNASKHVGEILARMASAGWIDRVSRGKYRKNKSRIAGQNPNQLSLL